MSLDHPHQYWETRSVYVITHDLELILDCCTDIIHLEDGSIIDQYGMDEDGLRKIRE